MGEINLDKLKEIEEFKCILKLYQEAKGYLENFNWCRKIIRGWYDFGLSDKLGVFLFNIEPAKEDVDDYIWVIAGDLPSAYIDKSAKSGTEALEIYCALMSEWAENVINGESVEDCYPIPVEQTAKHAEMLKSRIHFIRNNFLETKN